MPDKRAQGMERSCGSSLSDSIPHVRHASLCPNCRSHERVAELAPHPGKQHVASTRV